MTRITPERTSRSIPMPEEQPSLTEVLNAAYQKRHIVVDLTSLSDTESVVDNEPPVEQVSSPSSPMLERDKEVSSYAEWKSGKCRRDYFRFSELI